MATFINKKGTSKLDKELAKGVILKREISNTEGICDADDNVLESIERFYYGSKERLEHIGEATSRERVLFGSKPSYKDDKKITDLPLEDRADATKAFYVKQYKSSLAYGRTRAKGAWVTELNIVDEENQTLGTVDVEFTEDGMTVKIQDEEGEITTHEVIAGMGRYFSDESLRDAKVRRDAKVEAIKGEYLVPDNSTNEVEELVKAQPTPVQATDDADLTF